MEDRTSTSRPSTPPASPDAAETSLRAPHERVFFEPRSERLQPAHRRPHRGARRPWWSTSHGAGWTMAPLRLRAQPGARAPHPHRCRDSASRAAAGSGVRRRRTRNRTAGSARTHHTGDHPLVRGSGRPGPDGATDGDRSRSDRHGHVRHWRELGEQRRRNRDGRSRRAGYRGRQRSHERHGHRAGRRRLRRRRHHGFAGGHRADGVTRSGRGRRAGNAPADRAGSGRERTPGRRGGLLVALR